MNAGPEAAASTGSVLSPKLVITLVSIIALLAGFSLAALVSPPGQETTIRSIEGASVFEPSRSIPAFSLEDTTGQAFTHESLKGQWTFVFFGYTYCPDVCPTALMRFNEVHERLVEKGEQANTRFMFVSVDPPRDTLERLGEYVTYFNPTFEAATGDPEQIDIFARASGAVYMRVPGRGEDNYLIDHSAAVFLYDTEGRLKGIFSAPHDPQKIAKALIEIRS